LCNKAGILKCIPAVAFKVDAVFEDERREAHSPICAGIVYCFTTLIALGASLSSKIIS